MGKRDGVVFRSRVKKLLNGSLTVDLLNDNMIYHSPWLCRFIWFDTVTLQGIFVPVRTDIEHCTFDLCRWFLRADIHTITARLFRALFEITMSENPVGRVGAAQTGLFLWSKPIPALHHQLEESKKPEWILDRACLWLAFRISDS